VHPSSFDTPIHKSSEYPLHAPSHKSSEHPFHAPSYKSSEHPSSFDAQSHKSSDHPMIISNFDTQSHKSSVHFFYYISEQFRCYKAKAGSEGYLVDIAERRVHNIFKCET
jgi:hypothetical protein